MTVLAASVVFGTAASSAHTSGNTSALRGSVRASGEEIAKNSGNGHARDGSLDATSLYLDNSTETSSVPAWAIAALAASSREGATNFVVSPRPPYVLRINSTDLDLQVGEWWEGWTYNDQEVGDGLVQESAEEEIEDHDEQSVSKVTSNATGLNVSNSVVSFVADPKKLKNAQSGKVHCGCKTSPQTWVCGGTFRSLMACDLVCAANCEQRGSSYGECKGRRELVWLERANIQLKC